jgi:hypothetical protein
MVFFIEDNEQITQSGDAYNTPNNKVKFNKIGNI